ncbi:MAG: DMT family transporter, partial [Beijerinckiaceae bacterium]
MRYTSPPAAASPVQVQREERPLAGIAYNAAAFAAISVGDVLSKLAIVAMPTVQLVSVRTAFILLLFAPWFYHAVQQGDPPWRTQRLSLHLFRLCVQVSSIVTFLTALRHLPISTITAIAFMTPIFIALLARIFLGERLGWGQLISIVLGFAGCMIILQPGTSEFSPYMLVALYACLS